MRRNWHEATGPDEPAPAPDAESEPATLDWLEAEEEQPTPPRSRWGTTLLATLALLLALAWVAALAVGITLESPPGGPGALRIAAWIGLGSGPLALLALLWLLLLRTGRSEATAYARAARRLRAESAGLIEMLATLDRRIETARADLAQHAADLAMLGDSTADRLGRACELLRTDANAFAATAVTLDDAATAARTDLGVLLSDLPQAVALASGLTERLRDFGVEAGAQAETLGNRINALEGEARAADVASVGAARRLAAELERIEGGAAAVHRQIGETANRLEGATAGALDESAKALDEIRRGIDAQSAALNALVAQGRAALDRSGDDAGRALSQRLDALLGRIDALGAKLGDHGRDADAMLGQLEQALGAIESRFAALGDRGADHTADLAEAIVALTGHAEQVGRMLGQSSQSADTLLERIGAVRGQIEASSQSLGETMPAALDRLHRQATEGLEAIDATGPRADALADRVQAIVDRLAEAEALVSRRGDEIALLGETAGERLAELTTRAESLHTLLGETDQTLRDLAEGASGQLVNALLRVREAAGHAAERAREALATAIPAAAAELSEKGAEAMTAALKDVGRTEIAAVGTASEQAMEAARAASERLTRQLMVIADTSAQIEARAEADRAAAEARDEHSFARQVSLLIEALNSNAIDVTRILSEEPTDTAWAAYLKGDRGVFTRRAVRLLDQAEARTIADRYGDDPAFRDQVNRYVHDFEAMLRRVMAVREGESMGVTMLSSDMGKLYVALAQAIERLRR